jgi:hypothetical protein
MLAATGRRLKSSIRYGAPRTRMAFRELVQKLKQATAPILGCPTGHHSLISPLVACIRQLPCGTVSLHVSRGLFRRSACSVAPVADVARWATPCSCPELGSAAAAISDRAVGGVGRSCAAALLGLSLKNIQHVLHAAHLSNRSSALTPCGSTVRTRVELWIVDQAFSHVFPDTLVRADVTFRALTGCSAGPEPLRLCCGGLSRRTERRRLVEW